MRILVFDDQEMLPADAVRVAVAHALPAEAVGELVRVYGIDVVAGELERRAGMLREMGRQIAAAPRRRRLALIHVDALCVVSAA